MRILAISATEHDEEDFYLVTDLSDSDIVNVLRPIVKREREGQHDYELEHLITALRKAFPKNKIDLYEDVGTIRI
jgi:hypothetical protein